MKQYEKRLKTIQYLKLVGRAILLVAYFIIWVIYPEKEFWLLPIWIPFMLEMCFRLFPSKLESLGSRKCFASEFHAVCSDSCENNPISASKNKRVRHQGILHVAALSLSLTLIIGILFYCSILTKSMLIIIFLIYAVCDSICVLFFCPFQFFFMKNRCCISCRIYNWDYIMLFAPLLFIANAYSISLVSMSVIILIQWEFLYHRHPERFLTTTNASLSCQNCKEHNCRYKRKVYSLLASCIDKVKDPE